ncbi:MAG: sigma-70 family RNA polymerase sigma factor [Bacteroidetes bacterium]|nr:sigma-70 family RNA polymerase sigma factor [Bacteroidota bacterium]
MPNQLLKEAAHSDITLLSQLARGDKAAFTQLYLRYSATVYNALMLYIKDEHEADDLLQNIFIKIWEKKELLSSVQDTESYLFIMARNTVLNHLKRRAVEENARSALRGRLPDLADATDSRLLELEYRNALQAAIDALPPQQKQAYLLATEEALGYEAIAGRMGISKFTVKKHLELARKSVRAHINARFPGYMLLPVLLAPGFLLHA